MLGAMDTGLKQMRRPKHKSLLTKWYQFSALRERILRRCKSEKGHVCYRDYQKHWVAQMELETDLKDRRPFIRIVREGIFRWKNNRS